LKRIIRHILFYVNIAFVLALLLSYLSVYINPRVFWLTSFFGLIYPYILLGNLILIVIWVANKKKFFLISLITVVIGWGHVKKLIQIDLHWQEHHADMPSLSVLSYNVRLFNRYNWVDNPEARNEIFGYIHDKDPDIICFQEFFVPETEQFNEKDFYTILGNTPYRHIYYTSHQEGGAKFGIATFSKYPIVNRKNISFENSLHSAIFTDIRFNTRVIRIFNVYLQSNRLHKENYHVIDSLLLKSNRQINEIQLISSRLKNAYIKRAGQADELSGYINSSPYPAIVCGDFNDTPVSYAYRKIRGNMKDAFQESGRGFGNTYSGSFPAFRIDYIFHSRELQSVEFVTDEIGLSDHYPVSVIIIPEQ